MTAHGMNLLGGAIAIALLANAAAGHAQSGGKPRPEPGAEAAARSEGETLKERLSDKASDEQRVDNCKVPPDRRGTKPRPQGCRSDEARATLPKQP